MIQNLWDVFCYSVAKLCPALCDPVDCSTPGFPIPHHLPEFAKVHVHWISDATQPSQMNDTKKSSQRENILKNQQSQHLSVVSGAPGIHQHHLEFIRCQTFDPILDLRSQKLWVGANNLWLNKLSGWFWCTTNWENHRGKGWAENEGNSARKEKKWEFLEEVVNGDKGRGLKQSGHYVWWSRMFSMTLPGIVFHGWADWGLIWNNNNNNKMESKRKGRDR